MLELTFSNHTKHKTFSRPFFKKIIQVSIEDLGLKKKQLGLSVNLVTKSKMKTLNKKYRNKDKPTDVLSFPLHNQLLLNKTKETILELGDIFICPDFVNAKRVTKSRILDSHKANRDPDLKKELIFLTVHGFLHLLGYDHEKSIAEKKKMFQLQDKILKSL